MDPASAGGSGVDSFGAEAARIQPGTNPEQRLAELQFVVNATSGGTSCHLSEFS